MRTLRVALGAAMLAAVTATAGCGGGSDDKAACDAIKAELTSITTKGMQQISDPQGLAKTYADGAAKVRAEGKKAGGDVQNNADALATVMEEFGKTLTAGNGQIPDASAFTTASVKVNEACS
ncbi:hypothetical protein AB0J80_28575 [Actinoplanes sp. NPDC049548]|uniref:hypothetical protein n=1 Tax=Actinoplanes sp. NPDC049548 TaxID=3155152 RepID=UPI0034323A2C